jgi:hypothetical protein
MKPGWSALGTFEVNGNFQQLKTFPISILGTSAFGTSWTHIVSTGNGVFFYNTADGSALFGRFNTSGSFTTLKTYPAYYFPTAWTHIVATPDGTFFYSRTRGWAALGVFDFVGNITWPYASSTFTKGYSSVYAISVLPSQICCKKY